MYLCKGSHDFLRALHPGLCDSVPNVLTHHIVNFKTTKHQDERNEVLLHDVNFFFFAGMGTREGGLRH